MNVRVGFRLKAHKLAGLRNAPKILQKHLHGGLRGIGKRLVASSRRFMRRDTGEEQKSLVIEVSGSSFERSELEVYSTLTQAFIDAYGLRRGVFPAFRRGSRLYQWARRHANVSLSDTGNPTRTEQGPVSPIANIYRRAGGRITKVRRVRSGSKGTNSVGKQRRTQLDTTERMAWAIARSVYLHGIRPTHWNERALDANKAHIINDLRNAIARAAREMSRG
jgi:hypothetical protein